MPTVTHFRTFTLPIIIIIIITTTTTTTTTAAAAMTPIESHLGQ